MDLKPTQNDLLAHRDGELEDAELTAYIEGDAAAQAELAHLRWVKRELQALPPVTPGPEVWQAIQEHSRHRNRPWLERFPLATAATVFLAAALTIALWNPAGEGPVSDPGPQASDPVAALMLRSQRLESELFTRASAQPAAATSSEQALIYGIADVDAQLTALYESGERDLEERERLWRQRVMLLESLADVQRGQAILRPAIY